MDEVKTLCYWWQKAHNPTGWGIVYGILIGFPFGKEITASDWALLLAIVSQRMYGHE